MPSIYLDTLVSMKCKYRISLTIRENIDLGGGGCKFNGYIRLGGGGGGGGASRKDPI